MTYVVAYDDSALSRTALARAVEFGNATGERVVAVTAIKRDSAYARERGWLGSDETFDVETVEETLSRKVTDLHPDVAFSSKAIDRYAPRGRVARAIRELALEAGAEVLFVGSENAGRMVSGIVSVGQSVATDDRYDVHIVRHAGRAE